MNGFEQRRRLFHYLTCTLVGWASLYAAGSMYASSLDYGDFEGDTVMYRSVIENSVTDDPVDGVTEGIGIYGTPVLVGDALSFNVPSFVAVADKDNLTDVADALITFGLEPLPGFGMALSHLAIRELGSVNFFTPLGGTAAASVQTPMFFTIYEVMVNDGTDTGKLIPLVDPVVVQSSLEILSDVDIPPGWNSDDHSDSIGWVGRARVDLVEMVTSELPSIEDEFPLVGITQFQFSMNNTLTAGVNNTLAISFIDKKQLEFRPTVAVVPEPGYGAWFLISLVMIGCWRRVG